MSGRRSRPPGALSFGEKPQNSQIGQSFHFPAFKSHGNHKTNSHLFSLAVYLLQEKDRIQSCMLLGVLMTRI